MPNIGIGALAPVSMAEEAGVPTNDQVSAEARRLLAEALADEGIEQALRESFAKQDDLSSHVWTKLTAQRSFWPSVASIVAADLSRKRDERRRRYTDLLVRVLTSERISLPRVLMVLTGFWLAVVTSERGRGEITGTAIATGVFIAAFLFFSYQMRRVRRSEEGDEQALAQMRDTLATRRRKLIDGVILPLARERVNWLRDLPFSNRLTPVDAGGLGDLYDPEYEVQVTATERLREALEGLSAGSIGIAGPKGVGKTTLIRAACEGRLNASEARDGGEARKAPGVLVSAPIRYGAEDFVRHLFARLCLVELGASPEAERARQIRVTGSRAFWLALTAVLGWVAMTISIVLSLTGGRSGFLGAAAAAVLVGVVAGFLGVVWVREQLRDHRGAEDPITEEARRSLERLRYLETVSAEWTGEVSAKAGSLGTKRGSKRAMSLAAQGWTFPEMIESYRHFVSRLTRRGPVVVGIDELDKMASAEEARSFLNELKSLFDQPHVYYLVSVSEEALSDFERRGQPIRDVFDSIFSDVLHVDYLSEGESDALLRRRAIAIAPPWPALFHCLAGGLPRESLRVARRAVQIAAKQRPDLTTVTLALVAERAAAHERAVTVMARGQVAPDGTQPVLSWLSELPPIWADGGIGRTHVALDSARDALRMRLETAPALISAGRERGDAVAQQGDELERLIVELAAGWHHALSCLEFFAGLTAGKFHAARQVGPGHPSSIELLARGHQQLSASPDLSWQTVEAFRARLTLTLYPYPCPPVVPEPPPHAPLADRPGNFAADPKW